jgi:NAD(P)-dependent dehydrogenase (short-subunit alcohol dehydrogenase family)
VKRVAVISGAGGGGIGTAILSLFVSREYDIYSIEASTRTKNRLTSRFPHLDRNIVVGDVGNPQTIRYVYDLLRKRRQTCSIIVHNAARGASFADIEKVTTADLESDLKDILFGAFNLVTIFAAHLKRSRHGRIVLISSSAAVRGSWGRGLTYAACKAALHGLSKQLALQFAEFGTTCNVVVPFQTVTPRVMRAGRRTKAGIYKTAKEAVPLGRPALPIDVAATVAFLVSLDASYITGQEIYLDGGQLLAPRVGLPFRP